MNAYEAPGIDDIQLVSFRLGVDLYAMDILQLRRILRWEPAVPHAAAPDFVEGVLRQDGGWLPVVDLRKRFGLPAPVTDETRIVVLDLGVQQVGVVVDAARQVLRVDSATIAASPPSAHGLPAEYVAGQLARPERTILVLNPQRILSASEREALRRLESAP
ncbi:MAG TPA: chemotaxis protein CheW [Gemmatimonadales bacterium]|nr:chemotaxis protein CheW [Gemmatimonadales bacterium]